MKDILHQLADADVPETPPELDGELHQRINNLLLGQHVCELACLAIPYTFSHFLNAITGAACLSVSGHYPEFRETEPGEDHANGIDPDGD